LPPAALTGDVARADTAQGWTGFIAAVPVCLSPRPAPAGGRDVPFSPLAIRIAQTPDALESVLFKRHRPKPPNANEAPGSLRTPLSVNLCSGSMGGRGGAGQAL